MSAFNLRYIQYKLIELKDTIEGEFMVEMEILGLQQVLKQLLPMPLY